MGVGVDEMIFVMVEVLVVVGLTAWQNRGSNTHNKEYMNIENDNSLGLARLEERKCSKSNIKEGKSFVKGRGRRTKEGGPSIRMKRRDQIGLFRMLQHL